MLIMDPVMSQPEPPFSGHFIYKDADLVMSMSTTIITPSFSAFLRESGQRSLKYPSI